MHTHTLQNEIRKTDVYERTLQRGNSTSILKTSNKIEGKKPTNL